VQRLVLKELPRYECLVEASKQFPDLQPAACEAFMHLIRAGDEVVQVMNTHFAAHNITQGRFLLLMLLLEKTGDCPRSTTPAELAELAVQPAGETSLSEAGARLLARLAADPGAPALCWPTAELARRLGCGPPPLVELVAGLRAEGWMALVSGVMPGQFRSDAPWSVILQIARQLVETAAAAAK
jgi:hypothetical protein